MSKMCEPDASREGGGVFSLTTYALWGWVFGYTGGVPANHRRHSCPSLHTLHFDGIDTCHAASSCFPSQLSLDTALLLPCGGL